jgi:uncharacterized protein (TIGR03083 family)
LVDVGDAYLEVQRRLIDLVNDPGTEVNAPVPTCPGWRVRDVLAHHVGAVVDVSRGQFIDPAMNILDQWQDGAIQRARDDLTARQVKERRGRSVHELVEEWRGATERVLPLLRGDVPVPSSLPPFVALMGLTDLVVHEIDIRTALSLAPAPPTAALSLALRAYSFSLESRIRQLDLPSLVLVIDGDERQLGDKEVGATLRAERDELVCVLAGRRTAEQILGLEWQGDPAPFLTVLPEYGPVKTGE